MYYAQLDDEKRCVGVSQLSGEISAPNMVQIEGYDESLLGKKFEDGEWGEAPPVEIPLEDVRVSKLAELGNACTQVIYGGVDVATSQGVEHFSLTDNDQINIANLAAQAQAGAAVLYHADGKLCRMFTPDEMLAVATAAIAHKTYHTTLCNHYNVWARRAETRAELQGITYGAELPADLAASMAALLGGDANA